MNKSRLYDEMDIQAVESKLNDVTVTAIPMSSVGSKSYHHQNQKSSTGHNYSSSSSKSHKNQSQQQYFNYQQNQLVQSAIELIKQQQLQQQRQQLLENGVSINSTSHSATHAASHSGSASGSHSYANYGQNITTNGAQLASVMPQSSSQHSGLSKYAQLLAVIEEMGRDIRPTYAMGRGDRLKRLIIQAKVLVRECLMETERSARQ